MRVCVVGTGYVGLTTGVSLAFLGHDVVCVDLDEDKVEMLRAGRSPIYEPHMEALLAEAAERMTFTTDYAEAVPGAEVIFIAVQTPSLPDGNPDLQYLSSAADSVGRHIGGDFTVVVNKSTVPIGSSNWVDSILRDAFERSHGRRSDGEFSVASNPEFLREGVAISDSLYPDRIVVGSDNPRSLDVLNRLYRAVLNQTFTPPTFLPRPAELTPTSALLEVNGVRWLQLDDGLPDPVQVSYIAVDRPVYVALTTPVDAGSAPLQHLSDVVRETLPATAVAVR